MIHPDFQNVRSFNDFCRVSLPWPISYNDRARLWNMLVRMNENRQGRGELMTHTATFSERDFNVSFGSYFGSVSKITKMYRYILQNRRLRINGAARRDNNAADLSVIYTLSIGLGANELLDTWNPTGIVSYQGRGVSTPRRNRTSQNRASSPTPATRPTPQIVSIPSLNTREAEGWADNGDCNCEECRRLRRNDAVLRQQERERNASIISFLDGFMPFDNLSANVMATLMMEAIA